jgi:NTP pyrophosphatase (non-canonical NTP hydrolase)
MTEKQKYITGDRGQVDSALWTNDLSELCHGLAVDSGWWHDVHTKMSLLGKRNIPELLMLCVSELSEAMEGYRKDLPDDKLPHRKMFEVELADCLIRIFDLAGSMNLDLGGALAEKLAYNVKREDHTHEHRASENGKSF